MSRCTYEFCKLEIFKLFLISILCITNTAYAKRIALVMGNDNYTSVNKLQKAGNDATAMARELKAAGFTVQLHRDLNYRGMVRAVEAFTNNITGGDEVVVFFAGHGVQIRNGNFLLPTDIEANSESEVEKTAYELLALTDKISEAKPAFSLVMVDACRDNPLKSKGRNIGNARGLSAIEPPKGQMVVYSASRGQQALDRLSDKDPNPNGLFTREFIARMKKPGVKLDDLMREVQDSVENLAKTVGHEQRPAVYNETRGNFYFYGTTTLQLPPQSTVKVDSNSLELALWEGAKSATTIAEVQAYLNQFPSGFFAELANAKISAMIAAEKQATEERTKNNIEKQDRELNKNSTTVKSGWSKILTFNTGSIYINEANIKGIGNIRNVWSMLDYKVTQKARNGKEFLSTRTNMEIDCQKNLVHILQFSMHSGAMLGGEIIDSQGVMRDWQPIPPDTPLVPLREYACRN